MGKKEEIYTVHVKCKPDPSQNYPSERLYSSSTVGGLAFTHLFLGLIGTTLYAAAYSSAGSFIAGTILVSGCLLAFIAGILAWKRWYVDHHIRWFFASAILSASTSVTAALVTVYSLARPPDHEPSLTVCETFLTSFQREIHFHVILACLVEFIVSILSVKTSLRGIQKSVTDRTLPRRSDGVGDYPNVTTLDGIVGPDILRDHKNPGEGVKVSNYSNVVKELYRLQKSNAMGNDVLGNTVVSKFYLANQTDNGLPLPESQKEYQERMDKFLSANEQFSK